MLTYFCKYTPLELMIGYTAELREPNQDAADFAPAEEIIHSSVCSHAKMLVMDYLHEKESGEKQEMILTNCCDSVRRVSDSLPASDFSFREMLDLPHSTADYAVEMYANELMKLKKKLAAYDKKEFDRSAFLEAWQKNAGAFRAFMDDDRPCIAVLGARTSDELFQKIRTTVGDDRTDVVNFTCGGLRSLSMPPENASKMDEQDLMRAYARALLTQIPCMRMEDVSGRVRLLRKRGLKAIVYHSVRFCDFYSTEYAEIRRHSDLPVLKIESDYTSQSEGQLATRLEAFAESLRVQDTMRKCSSGIASGRTTVDSSDGVSHGAREITVKEREGVHGMGKLAGFFRGSRRLHTSHQSKTASHTVGENRLVRPESGIAKAAAVADQVSPREITGDVYLGIDSGSTTTNVAAIDDAGHLLAWAIVRTGAKAGLSAQKACDEVKNKLGEAGGRVKKIVATGYGRDNISIADDSVTEITCHARGAHFADPDARCIIDIGGQDSKVICLDQDGNVSNFVMNDKCAAGTGRFLEMMATTLEMSLDDMGRAGLTWKRDLTITSTCTVFAESEVVSFIAENVDTNDIVHALDASVASKTVSMVHRIHGDGPYMMTGGVAKNEGVAREIERRLGSPLAIMPHPDLIGALGAALTARG
ncbi:MAG: acyl-CoA dehydratase activase [Lachnospiraceae bacterium]|nr:acyl-CoA dehydratase activase [Lachnospiraceae bacterium]